MSRYAVSPIDSFVALLAVVQGVAALRVVGRFLQTRQGERIVEMRDESVSQQVSVIVPILDEEGRLALCLDGLIAHGPEVAAILLVDGGSRDGTIDLVHRYMEKDSRVRLIDGSQVPEGWNGKAWGLQLGLDEGDPAIPWCLTMDADVRPTHFLVRSLLAHARRTGLSAFSAATLQEIEGYAEGLLHPALLTTLVYRYGVPGHATRRVERVQANGQCLLMRRDVLQAVGGFCAGRVSRCDDVTVARAIAEHGEAVGFYETDALVSVRMYEGWRTTWRNWPRSLPLHDQFVGRGVLLLLTEVVLVQALPLPLMLILSAAGSRSRGGGSRGGGASTSWRVLWSLNVALLCMRLGVLAGTKRAYRRPPRSYWLSPLLDLPAVFALWKSLLRRQHEWRGRYMVSGGTL